MLRQMLYMNTIQPGFSPLNFLYSLLIGILSLPYLQYLRAIYILTMSLFVVPVVYIQLCVITIPIRFLSYVSSYAITTTTHFRPTLYWCLYDGYFGWTA